jgi:hypothetical protein
MEGDGERVLRSVSATALKSAREKRFERPGIEDNLGVEAVVGKMVNAAVQSRVNETLTWITRLISCMKIDAPAVAYSKTL